MKGGLVKDSRTREGHELLLFSVIFTEETRCCWILRLEEFGLLQGRRGLRVEVCEDAADQLEVIVLYRGLPRGLRRGGGGGGGEELGLEFRGVI